MARYYPVSPLFWSDSKVQSWSAETRLLSLYLLTCEHRNLEGLFRLPYAYIQADLEWPEAEVRQHMAVLIDSGFVEYDEAARVVFLPKALRYHQPKSKNQLQGAINELQQVPETTLWHRFTAAAREHAPALWEALGNPLPDPSPTPFQRVDSDEIAA